MGGYKKVTFILYLTEHKLDTTSMNNQLTLVERAVTIRYSLWSVLRLSLKMTKDSVMSEMPL